MSSPLDLNSFRILHSNNQRPSERFVGRYERLRCACVEGNSYERLPNIPTILEVDCTYGGDVDEKDTSNEKQEELTIFNDDGSYQNVVIERNLCAVDLCQLLALKNRVAKDVNWTISEHLIDYGLERHLEDHEDVFAVQRDSFDSFGRQLEKRFVFRKDFRKYEFFHNPEQFFPPDMVDQNFFEELTLSDSNDDINNLISSVGECPPVFGHVWVRDYSKQVWSKVFLLLRDRKLYTSTKIQTIVKFLRNLKNKEASNPKQQRCYDDQLHVFAHLADYHVYTTINAKNQFRAPTEYGLCLRLTVQAAEHDEQRHLKCLSCDSEQARLCWITAMRLAKYGKTLRENYKAFKNKQSESLSPKENYNSYTVPNESVRSRVAMDFTGSVGRIVEDPQEARAIAVAEGYSWKRRFRPSSRLHNTQAHGLDSGVHITQPWFHSGMSRDQAARLVSRHGTVDGVFLVRESKSSPGSFVLTFKFGGKVMHTQIQPVMDHVRDALCFSLDNGVTKFYDLLQLVEFYQLNAGCLPTRLTHYVVQSPTGLLYSEKPMATPIPASF